MCSLKIYLTVHRWFSFQNSSIILSNGWQSTQCRSSYNQWRWNFPTGDEDSTHQSSSYSISGLVSKWISSACSDFIQLCSFVCSIWNIFYSNGMLSLAASTTVFNKTTKVLTFQISSSKMKKFTRKQFAKILKLPTLGNFYEVSSDQVIHMFNEMRHQPCLLNTRGIQKTFLCFNDMLISLCFKSLMFRWLLSHKILDQIIHLKSILDYNSTL